MSTYAFTVTPTIFSTSTSLAGPFSVIQGLNVQAWSGLQHFSVRPGPHHVQAAGLSEAYDAMRAYVRDELQNGGFGDWDVLRVNSVPDGSSWKPFNHVLYLGKDDMVVRNEIETSDGPTAVYYAFLFNGPNQVSGIEV